MCYSGDIMQKDFWIAVVISTLTDLIIKKLFDRLELNFPVHIVIAKFDDTKGIIRSRKSKNRHCNGRGEKEQRDKQWTTKHYIVS